MAQIRIDTEFAREVGRRFLAESARVAELEAELRSAIGSLDAWAWDGRSRWRAEPLLSRVRPRGRHVSQELEELGRLLIRVADTFGRVDAEVVHHIFKQEVDRWPQGRRWSVEGVIAKAVGLIDAAVLSVVELVLPLDELGAEEYYRVEGEGGVIIPLIELELPFSGYIDGESGVTIVRDEKGIYRVIAGRAGGVGADFSYDEIYGAQVGVRGEQGYEFAFDSNRAGDLSKMALLVTTLTGSTLFPRLGPVAEKITVGSLRDNMISTGGGVGLEGSGEIDLKKVGKIEIEGTSTVGVEMRRDGLEDGSWDRVISRKLSGDVAAESDLLGFDGDIGGEFTFNQIVDTSTGEQSTEVILEVRSAAGKELHVDDIQRFLPEGTEVAEGFDFDRGAKATGCIEIEYTFNGPVEDAIASVREGDLESIIQNSEIDLSSSSGFESTVGGELKKSLAPGQTLGGKAKVETESGYKVEDVI